MLTRRRTAMALSLGVLMGSAARAGDDGGTLDLKYEYFWDRNQVWNHTPAFDLNLPLSRKWNFGWEQEVDVVSGASRYLGAKQVAPFGGQPIDIVSGASKVEERYSENPSLTYSHAGLTYSGGVYYSTEDDYTSFSPSGSFSVDLNDRNTTVGGNYAEFFDNFHPTGVFADTGIRSDQGGNKRISSVGATWAQTLTPLTLVGITADYIYSRGYLGHPYNPPMDSAGTLFLEEVPHRKNAGALSFQLVQGFHLGDNLGSINLDVRNYKDDWGLRSWTADAKFFQYLTDGFYLRLRGRYYTQTGTFFAQKYYGGHEVYRTADIRFFPWSSFLAGLKLSGPFPDAWDGFLLLPDRWDISYDQLVRGTHGDLLNPPQGTPRSDLYQLYGPDENYLQGTILAGLIFNL